MSNNIRNLWLPYSQMKTIPTPLKAVKTLGTKIYLENGSTLIDGISSWWTACHGHNHPHIKNSIKKQVDKMSHVMFGGLIHDQAIELSSRIIKTLPQEFYKVFFSDSGSIAVEVALKMAVQYWKNRGEENKTKFIYFKHAYHGDSSGAMAVSDPDEGMHSIFKNYFTKHIQSDLPKCKRTEIDFMNLLRKNEHSIAGIIIEPLLQAAGGMKTHSPKIINSIENIRKKFKVLLIFDEIATGFGRTGTMYALNQTNTIPDIICLGKAITGGSISLAATIATKKIYNSFLSYDENFALMHGPTYMANPVACAAANASLDLFEKENRIEQVIEIQNRLEKGLHECLNINGVRDVRVIGAMGAVQLNNIENDIKWLKKKFISKGVWLRPYGDIVYTMPPFVISNKELNKIIVSITDILHEWSIKKNN